MAAIQVRFLPGNQNVMINITEVGGDGLGDSDFSRIYEALKLPEQINAILGPGKGFKTPKNEFSISCSLNKKHCSIILNRSPYLRIDSTRKAFLLDITNKNLVNQIAPIWPQFFEFVSEDELLLLRSSFNQFILRHPVY